jgi:anaerobic magnesium-protoporphyrin IX monomethyl ester cyclase
VLVKPPERSTFNFGTFSLAALAAVVRDAADVSIEDATDLPIPHASARMLALKPDLVGITVMGTASVKPAVHFVKQLRLAESSDSGARARVAVVCGGHGASCMPAELLGAGADAVVIGEGEVTFRNIVENGIRPRAPGVACRVDGRLVIGPEQKLVLPLDRLPSPARDLMPEPPDGVHLMETSRGCPHDCAFCETTRFYRRRWRPYSPERVVEEVRRLVEDHGAWIIHFADDNFTANPKRVLHICERLRQRGALPAFFMVSARADDLVADPDLLPAMAAARILRVSVGVETLSAATALRVGKFISPDTYHTAFRRMRELGIFSVASLIVGLPGESRAERDRSVELVVQAGPDSAHFVPFLPLPGLPLTHGDQSCEPEPEDALDASAFTTAFFHHPHVHARLKLAAQRGGVLGLLARATLQNRYCAASCAGAADIDENHSAELKRSVRTGLTRHPTCVSSRHPCMT